MRPFSRQPSFTTPDLPHSPRHVRCTSVARTRRPRFSLMAASGWRPGLELMAPRPSCTGRKEPARSTVEPTASAVRSKSPRGRCHGYHGGMTKLVRSLPHPTDFPAPPSDVDRAPWTTADSAARPARLGLLRARMASAGVDAYFGIRPEHMRYLTGFALDDAEDKVAGNSGRFFVSADKVIVLADSRYRLQAVAQAPEARIEAMTHDLAAGWSGWLKSLGAKRVAVESDLVSHKLWGQLAAAAPD